jgi:acylphosphatase
MPDRPADAMDSRESSGDMVRVHLFVSGIVQGVFFRVNTISVARSLNLNGWVKNLSDGRVEVVAEGSHAKIAEFIEWCHKGPPAASVDEVEVNWEKPTGEFTGFKRIH